LALLVLPVQETTRMPDTATKWDAQLRRAAETRGTVTLLCSEGEKEEIAAAAGRIGQEFGIAPQLDRAPATGMRVGYRPAGGEGQPPLT
jgi:hypothetical protein